MSAEFCGSRSPQEPSSGDYLLWALSDLGAHSDPTDHDYTFLNNLGHYASRLMDGRPNCFEDWSEPQNSIADEPSPIEEPDPSLFSMLLSLKDQRFLDDLDNKTNLMITVSPEDRASIAEFGELANILMTGEPLCPEDNPIFMSYLTDPPADNAQ